MDDSRKTSAKNKIYTTLAIVFSLLFAMLWSLGTFFFWTFLGLASYFGFLAVYSSDIKFSMFERAQRNPYPPTQGRSATFTPPGSPQVVLQKIIRIIIIGAVSLFMLFFIIGIFSSNDDPNTNTTTASDDTVTTAEDDEPDYNAKGNSAFDRKQYDSAMSFYDKALQEKPDHQYALYNKGLVYFMKDEYRKSIPYARKCLSLYPDYNSAWWLLGDDYSNLNNYDSSIYCLEKAYNNDFKESDFLQLMAEVYLKKNNREKSTEFYKKVIEQDTTNVESYKKLIELDPSNADWYQKKVSSLESK